MKPDRPNKTERVAMLEAWRQSGLSIRGYSDQHHIGYHTLMYWYKKTKKPFPRPVASSKPAFASLKMKYPSHPTPPIFCELVTAKGKRLLFHPGVDACFLKTLLD
ncbi:MAG TPA: hypothetical protein VNE41_06680 [Chitinophagaceae bacterium]|nr:hypothetical protein [Chitinophagaceae bacterium]